MRLTLPRTHPEYGNADASGIHAMPLIFLRNFFRDSLRVLIQIDAKLEFTRHRFAMMKGHSDDAREQRPQLKTELFGSFLDIHRI
jgi:hypothetical protein